MISKYKLAEIDRVRHKCATNSFNKYQKKTLQKRKKMYCIYIYIIAVLSILTTKQRITDNKKACSYEKPLTISGKKSNSLFGENDMIQ